jgi:hypothetical protein
MPLLKKPSRLFENYTAAQPDLEQRKTPDSCLPGVFLGFVGSYQVR